MTRRPRVTVCVTTYNSGPRLRETLDSAWGQTFEDFELVAVDDGSVDGTPRVLAAETDPRLRFHPNPRNLGQAATRNRALQLARGEYVKFLDHDDLLRADCLARMVEVLDENERLGWVFSPRSVLLEDPADPVALAWRERFGLPHRCFGPLRRHNDRGPLFARWLAGRFTENWVGEPSSALVRRDCFVALGGFSRFARQLLDLELWLRLLARYDVGFVDEPLWTYRVVAGGETGRMRDDRREFLEYLWVLEGLRTLPDVWRRHPRLAGLRREGIVRAVRVEARDALDRRPGAAAKRRELARFLRVSAARSLGRPVPLHAPVPPA